MYSYQEESYQDCIEEVKTLIEDHYKEVETFQDKLKLSPDYSGYSNLDLLGVLHVYTVRESGELIGYFFATVVFHPHHKEHLFANNDIVYIKKEHRKKGVGETLISFAEEQLKNQDVSILTISTKTKHSFEDLLLSLGYEQTEKVYGKYLGE